MLSDTGFRRQPAQLVAGSDSPSAQAGATPCAIRLQDISVRFGSGKNMVEAIGNVSLDVKEGEFVSLIGHSGCGKSTLLRVIADIIQPSSGMAEIFGDRPAKAR